MPAGSFEKLRAMIAADTTCTLQAENFEWYYTSESEEHLKKAALVGNGSCVLLVQQKAQVPHTSLWRKGPLVKGNAEVPLGAAIASGWTEEDTYPSHPHHNHAALYLKQTATGLVVIDQWPGIDIKQFRPHTLRFGNRRNWPSNDGDAFNLIVTARLHR